jgi:hypothetical protein
MHVCTLVVQRPCAVCCVCWIRVRLSKCGCMQSLLHVYNPCVHMHTSTMRYIHTTTHKPCFDMHTSPRPCMHTNMYAHAHSQPVPCQHRIRPKWRGIAHNLQRNPSNHQAPTHIRTRYLQHIRTRYLHQWRQDTFNTYAQDTFINADKLSADCHGRLGAKYTNIRGRRVDVHDVHDVHTLLHASNAFSNIVYACEEFYLLDTCTWQ